MTKKVYKQKYFSLSVFSSVIITKNLNREILTKNLVTFKTKDGMGLRMKNFHFILWRGTVKSNFQGRGDAAHKNPLDSLDSLQLDVKRGLGKKEMGGVFEGELIP